MKKYIDLLFNDIETGEEFFVELERHNADGYLLDDEQLITEATNRLVEEYGFTHEELDFEDFVDEEVAEAMGLDTY